MISILLLNDKVKVLSNCCADYKFLTYILAKKLPSDIFVSHYAAH